MSRKILYLDSKHLAMLMVASLKEEKGQIHTITSDNGKEFGDLEYVSKKLV